MRILHNIYYPTFLLKKPPMLAVYSRDVKSIMRNKYDANIYGHATYCLNLDIWFVEAQLEIINFKLKSLKDEYLDYRIKDIVQKLKSL